MPVYLQGLSMGLAYVAPIGMQNLFVINAALTQPKRRLIPIMLIIVFFDVSLSLACFFGIGALMEALPWLRRIVLAAGSLMVMGLGVGLLRAKPRLDSDVDTGASLWRLAGTAFVVTWINPQAIIDGTLLIGAFRASLPAGSAAAFILGFTSASVLWFSALTVIVSLLRERFGEKLLGVINKVCGAVMIFYGAKLLYSFIQSIAA